MALTSKKILRKIGCDKLELVKGEGYWYFVYTDVTPDKHIYDTHSVYSMYLGKDSDLDFWVSEGRDFVAKMESK